MRNNQTDKERDAALLIEQALIEIDAIEAAKPVSYADDSEREYWLRRKLTMKDAKPKAKRAAMLLRQAWEILDPSIK